MIYARQGPSFAILACPRETNEKSRYDILQRLFSYLRTLSLIQDSMSWSIKPRAA